MRIISWNMLAKGINADAFARMLDEVGADVIIVQEPDRGFTYAARGLSRSMEDTSAMRGEAYRNVPRGWTMRWINGPTGQDNYLIGVRDGVEIKYSVVEGDPRGEGAVQMRNYVIVKLKGGGRSVTIASCHAPFNARGDRRNNDPGGTAEEYMASLFRDLGAGVRHPTKGVLKPVDVFMGDSNVYDTIQFSNMVGDWQSPQQSQTSGRGRGSALDRIAIRPNFGPFRCGRIYCRGEGVAAPVRGRGFQVEDIVLDPTPENLNWMRPDHLAIYLDTDPGRDGPGHRSPPPSPEFFRLDDRGRPPQELQERMEAEELRRRLAGDGGEKKAKTGE